MTDFKQYQRKQLAELRPWQPDDDMATFSISKVDFDNGSPKAGDMIARNPKNHADKWLVAAAYFADNFESVASWGPIEGVPTDGATVEVRGVMFVHHMRGAKFPTIPKDWRPETPQTEWRLTHWREAPALSEQVAERATEEQGFAVIGEGTKRI